MVSVSGVTEDQPDIYIDYRFAFHIRYIYVKTCPITLSITSIQASDWTKIFDVFWFSDLLEVKEGGLITEGADKIDLINNNYAEENRFISLYIV